MSRSDLEILVGLGWLALVIGLAASMAVGVLPRRHGRAAPRWTDTLFGSLLLVLVLPGGLVAGFGHYILDANTGAYGYPTDIRNSESFVNFCWFFVAFVAPASVLLGTGMLARALWQAWKGRGPDKAAPKRTGDRATGESRDQTRRGQQHRASGRAQPVTAADASQAALREGETLLWSGSPNPLAWTFARMWPWSPIVATLIILLVSQADFSQGTPRHGGNLLVAALLVLGLAALGTRLSRGAKQSRFLITDRRVVVVRPLVVRVAWVRQPRVVEVPLAELPPAEAARMPLCFGYGNVYFGRPGSWWIAPGGVHLGYLPVLNLEFYAIPDPAAVAQLANGLRTGTRRTEWRA